MAVCLELLQNAAEQMLLQPQKPPISAAACVRNDGAVQWRGALTVLDLLAVTQGLLEGLDHEGGGGGDDLDLRLTVLHDELARHAQALPLARRRLDDVIADLLRRHAERADLRRERRGAGHLAARHADVDVLDLVGVHLGRHG